MIVNQSAAASAYRLAPHLRGAVYAHAIETYPNEMCGLVVVDDDGSVRYVRADNIHPEPENAFTIDPGVYEPYREAGRVEAIVHSHTQGQTAPSREDMAGQIATGCPWVIVVMDAPERIIDEFAFPVPLSAPLKGLQFRPGVADCLETIRRFYWQEYGVALPPAPRDDQWWHKEEGEPGWNLFMDLYEDYGFRRLEPHEIRVNPDDPKSPVLLQRGDVGLARVMSPSRINHGVIYAGGQMMLHHLLMRVSAEEPVSRWLPRLEIWLRHRSQEPEIAREDDPPLRRPEG